MKKMLLLAAIQTAPGVAAVPTAAANAVLARGIQPEPIAGDAVKRELIRAYKGASGSMFAGEHRKLTCEVELAGSGTLAKAPGWDALIKACGFQSTVTAGTDVTYNMVSDDEPLITIFVYLDGTLFKMVDAMGTVNIELNAKAIPVLKFEFIGAYSPATEGAMPSGVDYSSFKQPRTVGKTNTPTLTIFGIPACTSALSINLANTLSWRDLINCAGPSSQERDPAGSITMEMPSATVKDWAEAVRLSETGPLNVVHGTEPGNIIELKMPRIQPGIYTLQDDGGHAMISMPYGILPTDGNDELAIVVR